MLKVVQDSTLSAIGDAIRSRVDTSDKFLPSEMPSMVGRYMIGGDEIANGMSVYARGLTSAILSSAFTGMSTMVIGADFANCVTVESNAFFNCRHLSELSLPNCTTIKAVAFESCYALATVSLPACETIFNRAFRSCSGLTELYAPNVTTIGTATNTGSNGPFESCSNLASVYAPNLSYAFDRAFTDCYALSEISLPNCVTVGAYAFHRTGLSEISLPACTSLSVGAFQSCSKLVAADLASCATVEQNAFFTCSSLARVSLPNCVTVGASAFMGCSQLSELNLPRCTTVGNSAFRIANNVTTFCSSLTTVSMPKVTNIGECLLTCQAGLTDVYMPLTSVVRYADFWGCSALSSLDFPCVESVFGNGTYGAFERCGVQTISFQTCYAYGDRAFFSCYSLMSLYALGNVVASLPSQRTFWSSPMSDSSYTGSFGSIYVPEWLYSSYLTAANWSVYSSRMASVSLSVGEVAPLSLSVVHTNGVAFTLFEIEDDTATINITESSAGHEGMCLEMETDEGETYVLEFDLRFKDTTFTSSYIVGFKVTNTPWTNYSDYTWCPNNIPRNTETNHHRWVFRSIGEHVYVSFEFDGLSDRTNTLEIRNLTIRKARWDL